ncbi:hypothetical protein ACFSUR_17980 [Halalkalibacter alkalisediminis]
MTVYKSIDLIAKRAAAVVMQVATKETVETNQTVDNGKAEIPSFLLEPISVTKSNIKETVIKDGFLSEKDIFN